MSSRLRTCGLLLLAVTSSCAKAPIPPASLPGSERDAHGCIPSAGYAWCEKTAQCERPWELAQMQGFALSQQNYDAFCAASCE